MTHSIEERLAFLERKIAEYEAERTHRRDLAELRDDLRLRIQATGAEIRDEIDTQADALRTEYHAGYTYLGTKIGDVEERVERVEQAVGQLQAGQQRLEAGQQQILEILLGRTKRND